jgi:hypothetical protein
LLVVQHASAQAKDPFIGKWLLDSDQSQFVPGPGPQDRIMTFETTDKGFRHLTETPNLSTGVTARIDYTAKFDGADYPIEGTGLDTVSLKRVDANTIERQGKIGGKVTETAVMKISNDGKMLTVTIKGNFKGSEYSSVQVLFRQ